MVKKYACETAEDSDADEKKIWMEKAPTRQSVKRGKYRKMNG